jgi:hypothetical protein
LATSCWISVSAVVAVRAASSRGEPGRDVDEEIDAVAGPDEARDRVDVVDLHGQRAPSDRHGVGEVDREAGVEVALHERLARADVGLEHAPDIVLVVGRADGVARDETRGDLALGQVLLAHDRTLRQILGRDQHGDLLAIGAGVLRDQRRLLALEVDERQHRRHQPEADGPEQQRNAEHTLVVPLVGHARCPLP